MYSDEDYECLIEQTECLIEETKEPIPDPVSIFIEEARKTAMISLLLLGSMVLLFWILV